MQTLRRILHAPLASLLAAAPLVCIAAPTSEDATRATVDQPPPIAAPRGDAMAPSTGGGQALDILVQLQPQTAGIAPKEQRQLVQRRTTPGPSSPASAQPANGTPLFGSAAVQQAAEARVDANWAPVSSARAAGGEPGEGKRPNSSSDTPLFFFLPREFVVFVRDNREWFVASVGAVVLVWVAATARPRRRS